MYLASAPYGATGATARVFPLAIARYWKPRKLPSSSASPRQFGKTDDRYGLIHADMRLANLLVDQNSTRLIDFDDCGTSWFLYDFAAAISFMENHAQIPVLRRAWLAGYRKYRPLSAAEENEIDTLIMLRRMALLAWMGSHTEVDIVVELSDEFARGSAELATRYLANCG